MAEQRIRSPFPGMDPYLEDPARWPDFHARLVPSLGDAIVAAVAPNYLVTIEERVYIAEEGENEGWVRPGLALISPRSLGGAAAPAVVAVEDEIEAPFVVPDLRYEEHREIYLVVKLRQTHEVVTVIELLSPTNKRPSGRGRDEYLSKREQVLHTRTSLVELDLLRAGARVPMAKPLPAGDYYVLVHRAWRKPMCDVFPFTVRDALPPIPIPLRGREQVRIGLQPIFESCYARARYELLLDYSRPAEPPLSSEDAAWAASYALGETH